jgi:hypothetical protein
MSEHAGNCGYVQKGMPCDCGLWEQSATLFKHQERIRELEAAIVKFWDYAKLVLPMPVHPAVGEIMRIGRDLESQSDRAV